MIPSTLLVVDDHTIVRRVVIRAVALVNSTAVVAESATVAEALQILQQVHIRAVVTDYRLPDGNGLEVLQAARQQHPDMPVLFVSGSIEMEPAIMDAGASAFLAKPIDFTALLNWLENALRTA